MRIFAEDLVNLFISQTAEAGRVAERASVFEINPIDGFCGRVEKKSKSVLTFAERLFHLLAAGNVLCKDENPSHSAVRGLPRTNLPACPMSAVSSIPTVFVGSQGFSLKGAAVNLFPTLRHVWKNLIVGTPQYLRSAT
jgi:hypothetical protein